MPMNKYSTLQSYFAENISKSDFNKSHSKGGYNKKSKSAPQPSNRVINFLLNYSQSLEAHKGMSYQLN